ncbi:RNA-binding S4 domain-containing protein [Aegicerativicinus sediminis]
MRIDKYLWCVRYFKTRSLATTACNKGQVKINGSVAKASKEVIITDKITLRKDQIDFEFKVNDIPKSRVGAKLVDIYRTDLTTKEAFEAREMQRLSQDYYRKKGSGRPTKKDRRDIDDFYEDSEDAW